MTLPLAILDIALSAAPWLLVGEAPTAAPLPPS